MSQRSTLFLPITILSLVALLAFTSPAAAQQDLSPLFDEASANFKPVSESELAGARKQLDSAISGVEQYVRPSSTNGQKWLRYLRWDDMKNALAAEGQSDLRPLAETDRRLNRDENGLEARAFRRMSAALERYIQLSQVARQKDQQQYYRSQLDALRKQIDTYRNEPTNATAAQIGARLNFVANLGGGKELVRAIRSEFKKPNAFMEVSTSLIAAGADPINRSERIPDCILGTSITSDAHTTGSVGVTTIPSDDKAIVEFMSDGHTYSDNVGYNGPAVIRSTANTNFTATNRVELTDEAFRMKGSHAHATTDTHLHSVSKRGGGLGSRLVANIGMNRARQSERQAERIAADHAEDRIVRNFDDEVGEKVRDIREKYVNEYRRPLERRGELPDHIRFSSDKDSINFETAQANRSQLAASTAPPEAPAGHDMSMRLHESAVNNYSASFLSGATATQDKPDEDIKFDVKLPEWMKDAWKSRKVEPTEGNGDEAFKPYALTFRQGRPISIGFKDGNVELTVHIERLKSGDNTFEDWDVTGIYTPEMVDGGLVLRRDEDLVMLPADFRGQLSTRQVAERRNLEEELNARSAQGRGFPKSIELEPLKPEGNLADAGPLEFNQFDSGSGWLSVAWDRQKKDRKAEPSRSASNQKARSKQSRG